ncbi:MAG: Wzz/FepE/Etk N-terminal domain-containing protein [Candidatus Microsaccharimonas sp.]
MQEINLYSLLKFYARNWWLILSLTLLGLLAGVVYNQFIQTPMYKSNATLLFINPGASTSTQDATLLNNYVQLFQSRRVLEPVISAQKLGVTYDEFSSSVAAVNEKGTEVIRLSVSTDNPEKSQKFLKAAVESFKEQAESLYDTDKLQVVDNASDAVPPYNVHKGLQLAIATGAGFVLSLIVLFFIYDAKGGKVEKRGKKQPAAKKPVAAKTSTKRKAPAQKESPITTFVADLKTAFSAENLSITPESKPAPTQKPALDVASKKPAVKSKPAKKAAKKPSTKKAKNTKIN